MSRIQPEVTVASNIAFDGRLITVRKETVRLPDGRTAERDIVVHPDVVAVLPVLSDGRVVLVRQYRKAVDRILLEVPAGGVESGESAEDAVRREMTEETGYRVGAMELLTSFYTSPGFTTELMHLYRAWNLEPGTPTETTDQIEVVLLSLSEARTQIGSEIQDAKTILALLGYAG